MSIRLMTKIWDGAPYSGGTLLVLLALADWANDQGERIFPHIETLAVKARLSVKQTRAVLKTLVEDGFLVEGENTVGGRGKRLAYKINVERFTKLPSLEEVEVSVAAERSLLLQDGKSASESEKSSPPYIDNHQEPSSEPPSKPSNTDMLSVLTVPDVDVAVSMFNEAAKTHPKWTVCQSLTSQRKKIIDARLKTHGLDGWQRAVDLAAASKFLGGAPPTHGEHKNWRMDIGWFAKDANFAKIIEGNYPPDTSNGFADRPRGLESVAAGIADALNQNARQ